MAGPASLSYGVTLFPLLGSAECAASAVLMVTGHGTKHICVSRLPSNTRLLFAFRPAGDHAAKCRPREPSPQVYRCSSRLLLDWKAVPGVWGCGKNPGIRSPLPYLHGRGRIGGTTQSGLSDMEHPSVSSDPHNSIAHIIAGVRGRTGHSRCSGMLALERRTSECSMGRYRSSSSHLDSIDWGRDQSGLRDPVSRFRDLGG